MTSLERRSEASNPSDNELIAGAKRGDAAAFAALYERFADRIYRHILYRTGSRADSEDLTQQTLIKAWQALPRYQLTETPFVAWLITIAQHAVVSYARRQHRHERLEPDPPFVDTDPGPSEAAERSFTREAVRQAVAKLPDIQQQVIVMHYLDGFDYAVIALALRKTENNIRVIAHRALKRLQGHLRDAQ